MFIMNQFSFIFVFLFYHSIQITHTLNINAPSSSPKTFVSYNIYKGKAALAIKPVAPVFSLMSTGNKLLNKDGGLLLEAAPGINL